MPSCLAFFFAYKFDLRLEVVLDEGLDDLIDASARLEPEPGGATRRYRPRQLSMMRCSDDIDALARRHATLHKTAAAIAAARGI